MSCFQYQQWTRLPSFITPGHAPELSDGVNVLLSQPTMSSVKRKLADPGNRSTEPHVFRSETRHSTLSFVNRITDEFISRQLGVNGKIGIMYDPALQVVFYSTRNSRCPFRAVHRGKIKSTKDRKTGGVVQHVTEGNHFYFVLYLLHGYMIQKCHSKKCQNM